MKLRVLLMVIVLFVTGPTLSAQELKELHTLKGHSAGCYSVAFTADGKTLASGTGNGWVKLWEVATGRELASFPVRQGLGENFAFPLHSLAFTPDGKTLASAGLGTHLKLWHVPSGKERASFEHTHKVQVVAFSRDGKIVAAGNYEGAVRLWDVSTGQVKADLKLKPSRSAPTALAFALDGQMLAVGRTEAGKFAEVELWDLTKGQMGAGLFGHKSEVFSVAFDPDGKTLAAGSRKVMVWDVGTRKVLATLKHEGFVEYVAFAPNGKLLVTGSPGTVKLWDVGTWKELANLKAQSVHSLAFTADGKILLASGDRGGRPATVKLYEVTKLLEKAPK